MQRWQRVAGLRTLRDGTAPTLFHLAVFAVPRPTAGAARGLAATTVTPARVLQREDGVALAADDRHEERGDERDEDENRRDYYDRRQRLCTVLRAYHVDKHLEYSGTSVELYCG